ncbi:Shedu anti-phage system protein SduA domain-containing protein [Allomuricauda taeanensis]|uniref:Shedu anti-phage system protein SduA domain-containing protein n=1 Tax=Flagellimonas taeanensis TaxID=1005926 RepID=UPI002E7BA2F4|nr:Shedu anti-phage system protein SduA domain-containing protein [Allomuricauda taeanensis]MEE1964313.1 Shedu anti-phage system protein SduA domain-containing protein [Allomuricauda taeanensis]
MGARTEPKLVFKLFDLNLDISKLQIRENSSQTNCFIEDEQSYYKGFILSSKVKVRTICNVTFYKSSETHKYLTRFEFRKENLYDESTKKTTNKDVRIEIQDKEAVDNFWKMAHFLQGFRDLVEIEDFQSKYRAISFDSYLVEYNRKDSVRKISELIELAENTELNESDLKKLAFSHRRKTIKAFYYLLKDLFLDGKSSFDHYKKRYSINTKGEEAVWHHFLKRNEWILGLNVDIVFIKDLLSEKKMGAEDSDGKGSSKSDLLGLNYFTTLIELKTANTNIFKETKTSKSRANTFDFSNDIIEAYSQILAQREDIMGNKEKSLKLEDHIVDRQLHRTIDPKCILIIGSRNSEFPHIRSSVMNTKSDTFERFRQSIRNIDIITFDELFERAYHIVHTSKLPLDWYKTEADEFVKEYL